MNCRTALLLLITAMLLPQSRFAYSQSSSPPQPVVVQAISIYDSPGVPDTGNHSILGGLLTGKGLTASLPNLRICVWQKGSSPDRQVCTQVCKPGRQCLNQPLPGRGLALDSSFRTVTVDIRDVSGSSSQPIATFDEVPANCDSDHQCTHDAAGGPVVISFRLSNQSPLSPQALNNIAPAAGPTNATPAPAPAGCRKPSPTWTKSELNQPYGLHGPYPSIDDIMMLSKTAGQISLQLTTNSGSSEAGFVILRDRRQQTGGYYTTQPVLASQGGNRPMVQWDDYKQSWGMAFTDSCENIDNFDIVATVHTHPDTLADYPTNHFTADDFNQAVQLKFGKFSATHQIIDCNQAGNDFEMIVMISAVDRRIHTFTPQSGDQCFWQWQLPLLSIRPTLSPLWKSYDSRVFTYMRGY